MTELEEKVIQHDEQIKTIYKSLKRLETITTDLNKLTLSVEKLAMNQTVMLEQQKELTNDVNTIKNQPAKDLHEIKLKVIIAIVTALPSALIGSLVTLLVK